MSGAVTQPVQKENFTLFGTMGRYVFGIFFNCSTLNLANVGTMHFHYIKNNKTKKSYEFCSSLQRFLKILICHI